MADLFEKGKPAPKIKAGWQRLSGGTGGVWLHVASGWRVRHCGHPTALWPYYGEPPGQHGAGRMLIERNGYAFRTVDRAKRAVEHLIADPPALAAFFATANRRVLTTLKQGEWAGG